jgi:hypothetical protein
MRWSCISSALFLMLVLLAQSAWSASAPATALETGYLQMYDLDFDAAHASFHAWEQEHSEDPLGPVSDAAAYLFSEFDRLHVLQAELFTDDSTFAHRSKLVPNLTTKSAFEGALTRGEKLAARELSRSPQDTNALFAQILANGLRSNYLAMIEKRNMAALVCMKTARSLAEKLLARDPSFYDAYLAVGVENYLLGITAAPVRWLLRIEGAETDKRQGLANLELTAREGRYLAPYARLLLAVAALRDKDRLTATHLLEGLARQFPHNPLYRSELARLQQK